ncbi:MAG: DNA polymerase I, partial [Bacteroidales bacterium]|nr:DNA polymerase I [Bacteroidales bacterium]
MVSIKTTAMDNAKKLFLLDAFALIFRGYYAFISRPIVNSKGVDTSAIFGFMNALIEIIQKEKPGYIAVIFDPPGPTFRNQLYTPYKANRDETPEAIKTAVPVILKLLDAMNIKHQYIQNYEADDVIGTLSVLAYQKGYHVYMVTPDKDYIQLLEDSVFMYKPRKAGNDIEIFDKAAALQKFEIESIPQFIDVLALMGDAADNVPGAPGIGEKTAIKLIKQFGSIDEIYNRIDELKGKQKEKLIENKEQVYLSRQLVTIKRDIEMDFIETEFEFKPPNEEVLISLLKDLEFNNMLSRILKPTQESAASPVQQSLFTEEQHLAIGLKSIKTEKPSYKAIQHHDEITKLVKEIEALGYFCFDTETTDIQAIKAKLVGISISFKNGQAYYIPFNQELNNEQTLAQLNPLFQNSNILKIGQNIKYDMQVLLNYGIAVKGQLFDTMIAHYLLQPDAKHNMDYLSSTYLNYQTIKIEELIGSKGNNQLNMANVPLHLIADYAAEDADITYQLYEYFKPEIEKAGLNDLFCGMEMPLIEVLCFMEATGVKIDTATLTDFSKELHAQIKIVETEIYQLAGEEFNIASPKQMGDILFEKLRITDKPKLTKTKQYSTNEEILVNYANEHPIINKILKYRGLSKLVSTYVDALPTIINTSTKRIHTNYNQAVAATGRLSSINPNLQNIPIRDQEGREIRKAFVPFEAGDLLLSADYSQIELRLIAHMSNDEGLISAFKQEQDIHTATAAKYTNCPLMKFHVSSAAGPKQPILASSMAFRPLAW